MPKKLFLIFSHELTTPQQQEAKEQLQVEKFVHLPDSLQLLWSNIPPDATLNLPRHLAEITNFLTQNCQKGDFALLQGDFGAVVYLVTWCKKIGLTPIYATTQRIVSTEIKNKDEVEIKRTFQHVAFRKYKIFEQ